MNRYVRIVCVAVFIFFSSVFQNAYIVPFVLYPKSVNNVIIKLMSCACTCLFVILCTKHNVKILVYTVIVINNNYGTHKLLPCPTTISHTRCLRTARLGRIRIRIRNFFFSILSQNIFVFRLFVTTS